MNWSGVVVSPSGAKHGIVEAGNGTPIAGTYTGDSKLMRYARLFVHRPRSLMLALALKSAWRNLREPKVAGAVVALTGAASYAVWHYKHKV